MNTIEVTYNPTDLAEEQALDVACQAVQGLGESTSGQHHVKVTGEAEDEIRIEWNVFIDFDAGKKLCRITVYRPSGIA